MTHKDENIRLLISLGLAGVMVAAILWLVGKLSPQPMATNRTPTETTATATPAKVSVPPSPEWMSIGDKLLVTADKTDEKEAGVNAFKSGDFATAIIKFQESLQSKRNDPETLIYLNNAKIGNSNALKVAVIAPIGSSVNEAKETLRGVAQAQDEVNNSGGINGVPLQLQIASLNNFGQLETIDNELAKDPNLLAVVGFGRNEKLYRQSGLVRVSPGSSRNQPGKNYTQILKETKYVFNVSPNREIFNQVLAEYIVKKERRTNIAICRDSSFRTNQDTSSTERSNQEIVKEYSALINKVGGRVTGTDCDLGAANFRASDFIARANSDGAEAILLIPRPTNINPALDVAKENRGRMALFGSQQLYSERILKFGQGDIKGLVVSVPWHRDANRNMSKEISFAEKAAKLWGGDVSPRTATAYDAMQVIIAGLKEDRTRQGLQKVLSHPNFSAMGATGEIKFSSSGDRQGGVFLVKIEPCESGKPCASSTGYDFALVQ
jgi:branched-chain amino acid transport system substrate-binding protein